MLIPCTDRERDAGATEGIAHVVVLGRTPQGQSAIMFSTLEAVNNSPNCTIPLQKYPGSVGQVESALDGLLGVI